MFLHPLIELSPEIPFEVISRTRIQEQQSARVRQKTRRQKKDSGHKDEQRIDQLLLWDNPLLKAGLDLEHGLHPLNTCKIGTRKSGKDHDDDGIEGADGAADLDEKIDLNNRYQRKCDKKSKQHGKTMIPIRGYVKQRIEVRNGR